MLFRKESQKDTCLYLQELLESEDVGVTLQEVMTRHSMLAHARYQTNPDILKS